MSLLLILIFFFAVVVSSTVVARHSAGRGGKAPVAVENPTLFPPLAQSVDEGDTLTELLSKRDNAIGEWDAEESAHTLAIQKMKEAMWPSDSADLFTTRSPSEGLRNDGRPTLSDLIASGVGMMFSKTLTSHLSMDGADEEEKRLMVGPDPAVIEYLNKNNKGGSLDAKTILHLETDDDEEEEEEAVSEDDEGKLHVSTFALFVIALLPGLIAVLVIVTMVILLFTECWKYANGDKVLFPYRSESIGLQYYNDGLLVGTLGSSPQPQPQPLQYMVVPQEEQQVHSMIHPSPPPMDYVHLLQHHHPRPQGDLARTAVPIDPTAPESEQPNIFVAPKRKQRGQRSPHKYKPRAQRHV